MTNNCSFEKHFRRTGINNIDNNDKLVDTMHHSPKLPAIHLNLMMASLNPPLHRHLSTIGIGPVFLRPPPHPLPQPLSEEKDDLPSTSSATDDGVDGSSNDTLRRQQQPHPPVQTILTWETVGTIKMSPEDFVVREISLLPTSTGEWTQKVAGSDRAESTLSEDFIDDIARQRLQLRIGSAKAGCGIAKGGGDVGVSEMGDGSSHNSQPDTTTSDEPNKDSFKQDSVQASVSTAQEKPCNNPKDGLRDILQYCCRLTGTSKPSDEYTSETILQQLMDLQNSALDKTHDISCKELMSEPTSNNEDTSNIGDQNVWIPTSNLFQDAPSANVDLKQMWKLLHQYIRLVFPLLMTEVSCTNPAGEDESKISTTSNGETDNNKACKPWIIAIIDRTFFPLARYLAEPRKDLLALYKYRSIGPVPSDRNEDYRGRSTPSQYKKRKWNAGREQKEEQNEQSEVKNNAYGDSHSNDGTVLLRLKPDLPRDERRQVHRILIGSGSNNRRDFETTTRNNVSLNSSTSYDTSRNATTAIVVQWSRAAIQTAQKRKNTQGDRCPNGKEGNSDSKSSSITATLCVVQKEQVEHQVAMQHLVRALRCRPGDIGCAGIKDMQAITYQFCTFRGIDLQRARQANSQLLNGNKRVALRDMELVKDFLLDRGKLIGNRFEILVRDLKRVERKSVAGDALCSATNYLEQMVPCRASHINEMVNRIKDCGFINFYGEQRVGEPGSSRRVGVRSFDVGRALLRQQFAEAVDLIMAGRSSEMYFPSEDEVKAREIWKTSGGDARATLKAFPKSQSTMVRERDLMKGMLRYGNALEALRCVTFSSRTFWIHSYQSYIWNKIATERIIRHGLRPVVGDLYLGDTEESDGTCGGEEGSAVNIKVVTDPNSVDIFQIVLPVSDLYVEHF